MRVEPRNYRVLFLCALLALAAFHGFRTATALGDRSLIPVALDAVVIKKDVRTEKHPGQDDALVLQIRSKDGSAGEVQVDRPIFEAVSEGDSLAKAAGERELRIGGERMLPLAHSTETGGMRIAIGVILAALSLSVAGSCLPSRSSASTLNRDRQT